MYRLSLSTLAVLVLAGSLCAADPLVLPASVTGEPGDFIVVRATTEGKTVRWLCLDSGLKMLPPEVVADPKVAVVLARAPGKFRLLAYSSVGDTPTPPVVCVVVVGQGPDPVPPPVPPTPPTDPFTQALQASYAADTSPQKAAYKASLAALYRQAVATAADPQLKTTADLFGVLKTAAANLLPADALPTVRARIAQELLAVLPTSATAPLDAVTREKAAQVFTKVAAALDAVR